MASRNVIEVDDVGFEREVTSSEEPVLVDFTATWCGPCRALSPLLDAIADENVGKFKVVKVDMDAAPASSVKHGVRAAPTLLVFRKGEVVARHVGLTSKSKIVKLVTDAA